MRKEDRQDTRLRFDFRCGYCKVNETDIGAELTTDHFRPRAHGGDESSDNLVYSCHACNEFKSQYWQTEPELRLIHPGHEDASRHYLEREDGTLAALTERGTNHIETLHLNRKALVAHRLQEQYHTSLKQLFHELQMMNAELDSSASEIQSAIEKFESR